MGNAGGEHVLACEWVGTHLARWLGLPTFDFAIIEVATMDELPFAAGGRARPGPAFFTRAESGQPWGGRRRELRRLINPQEVGLLVLFDTWALNCDPYFEGDDGRPRINRDNVFLSEAAPKGKLVLKAMDHTHCFTCGRDLTDKVAGSDRVRDQRLYGLFPEFRLLDRGVLERAAARLRELKRDAVEPVVRNVPSAYEVRGPFSCRVRRSAPDWLR
jgi:hypothetical protein